MFTIKQLLVLSGILTLFAGSVFADDVSHSTVAVGGYDVVSYRTGEKPVPGNGNHVSVYQGVTYLFQTDANRKQFDRDPERFAPAYGGFCAYGASVGKKFVGDPNVWEVVDNRLFLNLDNKIKGIWSKDIPGNIKKADSKWPGISGVAAAQL